MFAGALTLIALQVFGSGSGPQRGGALLQWVAGGITQLISPDKAAIPNVSSGGKPPPPPPAGGSSTGGGSGGTPASLPRNPTLKLL